MSATVARWLERLLAGCAAPDLACGLQAQLQPAAPLWLAAPPSSHPVRHARRSVRRPQGVRA